jgi:tetratricopeptide (TPR) repeat protein
MATARQCPECGASVPLNARTGWCPHCELAGAIALGPPHLNVSATSTLQFGDYELLEQIGQGGMGVVYRARQVSLNRIVAVKMIIAGQLANAEDVRRFQIEASSAAALQHPNIIPIYEISEHAGHHYFTMEFVDGDDLADKVREHPLPAKAAARYVRIAAGALQYAHECGILHRDLKPSNILIDPFDQPRLADFGLAKRMDSDGELTLTGQILGAPSFVSPEQAAGRRADVGPRSDLYALGAILYHLLTGRPPFSADTLPATLAQVENNEPAAPRVLNPAIPRDLETICLKCLEKDPRRRYTSARELAEELERFERGEPILARPVGRTERSWRWCRRHRAVSALLAFVIVLHFVIAWLSLYINHRVRFVAQKEAALRHEAENAEASALQHQRLAEGFFADATNKNAQLATASNRLAQSLADLEREKQKTEDALERATQLLAQVEDASRHASNNWHRAEENAAAARKQQAHVEETMDFLLFDLSDKLRPLGRVGVLRDVTDRVLGHYRSLTNDSSEDAVLRRAHAYKNAAQVLALQGDSSRALETYRASFEIFERMSTDKPDAVTWRAELCFHHQRMGELREARGEFNKALEHFDTSLAIASVENRRAPHHAQWNAFALAAHLKRGDVLRSQAQRTEALEAFFRAVNTASNLIQLEATNAKWQRELSFSYGKVSALLLEEWGIEKALPAAQVSWEIASSLATNDPASAQLQLDLATSCDRLGDVHMARLETKQASRYYREAREIRSRLVAQDAGNAEWRSDFLQSQLKAAEILARESKESKTLEAFRRGARAIWEFPTAHAGLIIDLFRPEHRTLHALEACSNAVQQATELAAKDPDNSRWQEFLATAHTAYGDLLFDEGENKAALQEYEAALTMRSQLVGGQTNTSYVQYSLALSHANRGAVLKRLSQGDRALTEVRASLGIFSGMASQWPGNFIFLEGPRDTERNLSRLSLNQSQQDELGAVFGRAYVSSAIRVQRQHDDRAARQEWAGFCSDMAVARFLMGHFAKAAKQAAVAADVWRELSIENPGDSVTRQQLSRSELALAAFQILRRDGPAAIKTSRRALERDPDALEFNATLAMANILAGNLEEARAIVVRHCDVLVAPKITFSEAVLADVYRFADRGIPQAQIEKFEALFSKKISAEK